MARRLSSLAFVVGLFVLMIPAASAGGGCHGDSSMAMTSSTSKKVAIMGCSYDDTVIYAEPGDSVTWTNKDEVGHTVTGALGSWGNEDYMERGDEVTYRFDDEGVYPYYCVLHPGMVGAVAVGVGKLPAGISSGGVSPVEQTVAAAPPSVDSGDGDGAGAAAITGASIAAALVALVLAARVVIRRRAASTSVA